MVGTLDTSTSSLSLSHHIVTQRKKHIEYSRGGSGFALDSLRTQRAQEIFTTTLHLTQLHFHLSKFYSFYRLYWRLLCFLKCKLLVPFPEAKKPTKQETSSTVAPVDAYDGGSFSSRDNWQVHHLHLHLSG